MLPVYGFVASILPVWLLLAPRDYLSTYMKLGTVILLALAIVWMQPTVKMPALTQFIDGTGPIFGGTIFPFVFITIACGAVSGFHSLISSGTTPKLLENETHARYIGYIPRWLCDHDCRHCHQAGWHPSGCSGRGRRDGCCVHRRAVEVLRVHGRD